MDDTDGGGGPSSDDGQDDEGDPLPVSVEYREDTNSYHTSFGEGDESPSMVVVSTIAAVSGRSFVDLPPLYTAVDPEALETLVAGEESGPDREEVEVTFTYADYEISVDSDGEVEVRPIDSGEFS